MFSVALGGGKRGRQEGKRQGQGEGGTEREVVVYIVGTVCLVCAVASSHGRRMAGVGRGLLGSGIKA